MKQNLTDINILLDRSGSMEETKGDTIGGFNRFLRDQRDVVGEATLSLVQFDNVYEELAGAVPIGQARELTRETYLPRGSTALYDAICRMIDDTGKRLGAMAEGDRPSKVVFVIMTDGLENASRKHNSTDVSDRITKQRDTYKWEFVFIGANQDAIATGSKLGVPASHSMNYAASAAGTANAYAATSQRLSAVRCGMSSSMAWSDEDRAKQDAELARLAGK